MMNFLSPTMISGKTMKDLDNRNRRNNIRVHGIPESVTDLTPAISKLFHKLLSDKPLSAFTCDGILRALRPKPTPDKPPCVIIMCMKEREREISFGHLGIQLA